MHSLNVGLLASHVTSKVAYADEAKAARLEQINRLFEEVARLSEMDLPPSDYYGEFLKRVLMALAAPAGAVWGRTAQGNRSGPATDSHHHSRVARRAVRVHHGFAALPPGSHRRGVVRS